MKVVFLQDIPNVAEAGDIKTVKRGYAKNYLLPRNLAVTASAHELNRLEAIKKAAVVYREKQSNVMGDLAQKIQDLRITIVQRAGPVGQLYGSVTAGMIAHELSGVIGSDIDRRSVTLTEAIRQTGEFEASIRLGPAISATFNVTVIAEDSVKTAEQNVVTEQIVESDVEEDDSQVDEADSDEATGITEAPEDVSSEVDPEESSDEAQ